MSRGSCAADLLVLVVTSFSFCFREAVSSDWWPGTKCGDKCQDVLEIIAVRRNLRRIS